MMDSSLPTRERYFARRAAPITTLPVPKEVEVGEEKSPYIRYSDSVEDIDQFNQEIVRALNIRDFVSIDYHRFMRPVVLRPKWGSQMAQAIPNELRAKTNAEAETSKITLGELGAYGAISSLIFFLASLGDDRTELAVCVVLFIAGLTFVAMDHLSKSER